MLLEDYLIRGLEAAHAASVLEHLDFLYGCFFLDAVRVLLDVVVVILVWSGDREGTVGLVKAWNFESHFSLSSYKSPGTSCLRIINSIINIFPITPCPCVLVLRTVFLANFLSGCFCLFSFLASFPLAMELARVFLFCGTEKVFGVYSFYPATQIINVSKYTLSIEFLVVRLLNLRWFHRPGRPGPARCILRIQIRSSEFRFYSPISPKQT